MGPVERKLGRIPKRVGGGDWDKRFAQRIAFVFEPGKAGRCGGGAMDTEMSAKAVAVLKALAHRAADGKSTTIAHDWGFGSATVIDESGTHTHCGGDWYERDDAALKAFINGMHSILCVGAGLSWVGPNV